jgi:hypothetical protein
MKIVKSILFLYVLTGICFGQSYNWITPNKAYLKLYVIDDGIYRIGKSDFTQAGINTSNIDPRTVKVYYKGSQVPIYFEGEQDGTFDDNDFFDFYGTRNYGGLTNTYYDSNGTNVVKYVTNEYYNQYYDTSAYWVGWDGPNGLRFTISTLTTQTPYLQGYSYDRAHMEKDSVYTLGETLDPNSDFRYFNTEKVSGEGWFWKNLTAQAGYQLSTSFLSPDLFTPPQTCLLKIFAYPNSQDLSATNEHNINVSINNTLVASFSRSHYNRFDTTVSFSGSVLSPTALNQVAVHYAPAFINQNLTPSLYFDMLDIQYPRTIKFTNSHSKFYLGGTDTSLALFSVSGFNAGAPISIYDIKNNLRITTINSDTGYLFFTGMKNGSFEVYNEFITKKPFRIIQRQVPDLVNPNSAQYMVIYNKLFESQAEELRSYRQSHDKFHTFKAAVDDVTDIFNYGMEDPVAIRRFIDNVMRTWRSDTLQYVCLFGRGSLDPKHNVLTNEFYRNLIPVYGNPPSDGYFANNNFGGFTYYKKLAIGRIPAYTVNEAQNIVNKIISYDGQQPENWWKLFTMVTGGKDRQEQIRNQQTAEDLLNSYIIPPPISGEPHKIYRNDSSGYITYNYSDSIIHEINRGSIIVNFIGHAASQDWELGLTDPGILVNGTRLPLVLSMTCFTGRNAETESRSFGEKFLYNPGGGCIGFVGTTGWSFNTTGNILNQQMLSRFSQGGYRRIGDLLKLASQYLASDSLQFFSRNMVNSYDLLGDPASKLLLPTYPEFAISQSDYRISDPYPLIGEQVSLTIFPKNFGTFATSCLTRFEILRSGIPVRTKDTTLVNFGHYDTANYVFRIDTLGNYAIRVTLDANNHYPEEIESNNVIIITLPLRNISYTPLKPIYNSVIKQDSVEFVGLNPQVDPARNSVKIILQVDTTKSFSNPLYTFTQNSISGVVTKVRYRVPTADSNVVYFWRTNSIVNNDSTGWSATMRFVFDPLVPLTKIRTVKSNPLIRYSSLNDSNVTVYEKLPGQFEQGDINNLQYNGSGYELKSSTGLIQLKSYGNSGAEASYFQLPGYTLFFDNSQNAGLNIGKASRLTGKLLDRKNFTMTTPQSSDSVLNFLNTFDSSHYLLTVIVLFTSPSDSLHLSAKNKFKQFGSTLVDSVTSFAVFDTWAFIGYLGAPAINTSEQFHNYPATGQWIPSLANLTATFLNTSGSINFSIGPSHRWKNFSWGEVIQPNSNITYDVIGLNRAGLAVTLLSNVGSNSFVNLDTLNSYSYPNLQLKAKLKIDTLLGFRSPVFNFMNFKYTPPAELIPDNYSFTRSDSLVPEGTTVTFAVKNYNVGFVPANAVIYKWTSFSTGGVFTLRTDTVYTPLNVDSMKITAVTFNTQGLRDPQKLYDTLTIEFEAEPLGSQNDYFYFNNFAFSKLIVKGDTTRPQLEVTFDGQRILNSDPISAKPEILYKFYDYSSNSYSIIDTSKIYIMLLKPDSPSGQPVRIPYTVNGALNPDITFNPLNNGNLKVAVTYKPTLDAGNYNFYFVGENQNNKKDTVIYNANVTNQLSIMYLYNFPNPMKDNTNFTFMLFAPEVPQSCKIKIYTVAGRLVKEINSPARVGFNSIYWDGRDNDGDNMANGIYLYKVILEDAGKTETSVQKLAILK